MFLVIGLFVGMIYYLFIVYCDVVGNSLIVLLVFLFMMIVVGMLMSGIVKCNNGIMIGVKMFIWIMLLNDLMGVFVVIKMGVFINSSSVFMMSDVGMVVGIVYWVVWKEFIGECGYGWVIVL